MRYESQHYPSFLATEEFISHPGDQSDSNTYNMHCPEAALPTVSLLGVVRGGGGELNNGSILLHYDLETSIYDVSSKASVKFTVSIYFRNGNRWTNFPSLARQSRIFITGRIFGITNNTPRLAIGVDDVYFIPNLSSVTSAPVTPGSSAGTQKQADRWRSRANQLIPTKRSAMLTSISESQPLDTGRQICPSSEMHRPIESERSDEGFAKDAASDQPNHLEDRSSADTIPRGRPTKRGRRYQKVD